MQRAKAELQVRKVRRSEEGIRRAVGGGAESKKGAQQVSRELGRTVRWSCGGGANVCAARMMQDASAAVLAEGGAAVKKWSSSGRARVGERLACAAMCARIAPVTLPATGASFRAN